jgi:hypothetical protein
MGGGNGKAIEGRGQVVQGIPNTQGESEPSMKTNEYELCCKHSVSLYLFTFSLVRYTDILENNSSKAHASDPSSKD